MLNLSLSFDSQILVQSLEELPVGLLVLSVSVCHLGNNFINN